MYSSCIFTNFGIFRLKDAVWTHPDSSSMIHEYILEDKEIDFDRLEDVLKNIGFPTMASTFIINLKKFKKYFDLYFRSDEFKRLKKKSDIDDIEILPLESSVLKDKSIVLTGFRDKELKEIIAKHGGKVTDSVTKKTFAVIAKDKNEESTKISKARSLEVKIYDKEEFLNILN
jgi:NAD-dependent DNA ligase